VLFGEAEVGNDGSSVIKEDVGQFEIPVQVAPFCHLDESCYDILHDLEHFLLADSSPLLQEAAQIALIAELSDDEAVGSFPHHVVALKDIGMLDLSQSLDLAI
jgi:hypothetical protein